MYIIAISTFPQRTTIKTLTKRNMTFIVLKKVLNDGLNIDITNKIL